MTHSFVSPAQIQESLKGMDYPASREELIDHVKKSDHEMSKEVLMVLEKFPKKQYDSPVDVSKAVSDVS